MRPKIRLSDDNRDVICATDIIINGFPTDRPTAEMTSVRHGEKEPMDEKCTESHVYWELTSAALGLHIYSSVEAITNFNQLFLRFCMGMFIRFMLRQQSILKTNPNNNDEISAIDSARAQSNVSSRAASNGDWWPEDEFSGRIRAKVRVNPSGT